MVEGSEVREHANNDVTPEAALEVRKKVRTTFDVPDKESVLFALTPQVTWCLRPSRYSSWTRLRVRAWVHRIMNNCGMVPEEGSSGELTSQEISDAETDIIKEAQQEGFQEEIQGTGQFQVCSAKQQVVKFEPHPR